MNVRKYIILPILGSALFFVFWNALSGTQYAHRFTFKNLISPEDSTKKVNPRRPTYSPDDRYGDNYNNPTSRSPLELKDPDNIQQEVELDTATGDYIIKEKIGDMEYRPQTNLTFEEYYKYKNQQMLRDYWQNKHSDPMASDPKQVKPGQPFGFSKHIKGLEGPFGSNYVDIRPNGLVTLDFAGRWQRINNPALPIKQQRTGLFDFEQQISMNVVGKIGEKLKLTVNWDTKAAFEFQNSVKIQYTAFEEDIIQAIEVGRVTMPLNSSLMTGPQNLFGFKTKLQFGRLAVTAVAARQDGKLDEIKIAGGGQGRTFEIRADGYEDYRHFFLGQFFRNNYEQSLKSSPTILSGVQINRVDVYVTNRNNTTTNLRNIVGYLDLGEDSVYRPTAFIVQPNTVVANNTTNNEFALFNNARSETDIEKVAQPLGLENGTDYMVLNSARKLATTEFTINNALGYITLQTKITPDQALMVAYEYQYNGITYRVGELNESISTQPTDSTIITKMIKPPVIKTRLPTWDLMMKNIYPLGVTQVMRDNFQFRIIYKDDATGADIPNLQEGVKTSNVPLLRLSGLDRLNPNGDPYPDGNFDFVDGITIDTKNGRIMFPVLEPFGSNLNSYFLPTEAFLKSKYVFSELYDSTLSDAQQVANKNKYFFKGRYNAGTSSEIVLPGINVSQGSVTVIAGSTTLSEGVDYTVDYNLGRIKILNEGVLASGQEIRIRFEKQDLFNFRRKTFMGTRLDYKVNNNILLGATALHSNEAPNITRVNIGDEPASNTIWGFDANVKQDSRLLTKAVDLLPVISTKAPSNINFQGEFAQFIPGYNKIIDKNGGGEGGIAFIDDFEGSKTPYDLTRSPSSWRASSTPQRFAESRSKDLSYAYRKALLAWYNIDNIFYRPNNGLPAYISYDKINNHYERNITQTELYPNQDRNIAVTNITTLDLAYYPRERGSNNYTPNLDVNGNLKDSSSNWAGITKDLRNDIDFDNANIQYIEFWLLSPYIDIAPANVNLGHTNIDGVPFNQTNKGTLYFNLGSISEDVLSDNLQSFENGLPANGDTSNTQLSPWGRITKAQFVINAFDNSANARPKQDVGLDGLDNAAEALFFTQYITGLPALTAGAKDSIMADISADNFSYYLGDAQNSEGLSILQRYKKYNRTENNSPLNSGASITPSSTNYPDNEDLNGDNTLNTVEEYYEYKVVIDPSTMKVGENYIVSSREYPVTFADATVPDKVTWYQFRIPIRNPDNTVGNIQGYKSLKWMRTYVTDFESPVVLRMAQFQLVANQWRVYKDDINQKGGAPLTKPDNSIIDVSTVNIEENSESDGNTTPYVLPPGFNRDYDATSTVTRRTNEQSLRLCIDNLQEGGARAVFKTVSFNLMNYKNINMFIHAESTTKSMDTLAYAFIRLGTDFKDNYYEIQVPLYFTNPINSTDPNLVWRSENEINMAIAALIDTKVARNNAQYPLSTAYQNRLPNGQIIVVVGNPDMSAVVTIMLGLKNPIDKHADPLSFFICAGELRTSGFVTHSSYAYAAKLNLKLADLGTLNSSVRYTSSGFGSLDQKASQRERYNTLEYGINSNIALDKFIPAKLGIRLPMYIGYNRKVISPDYDPLNPDVTLAQSVNNAEDPSGYKKLVIDQTNTKALNFTNIQKVKTKPDAKKHVYDIENLNLSVGFTQTRRTSYDIKEYKYVNYNGSLGYNYSNNAKNYQPLKQMASSKNPINQLLKEFNFAFLPSQLTFGTRIDRLLTTTQYYESGPLTPAQTALYEKSFLLTRNYGLMWNLTKSITTTYKANANAIVDEPSGAPGGPEYRDSVISNLLKFGRLKNFEQFINLNYKLPLDKIKQMNWTSVDYSYNTGYSWRAGALVQKDTLGNQLLKNSRDNVVTSKIDFEKLYSKSKFLAEVNNPKPKPKGPP
ncbi:MAG: cell surface protein SprA, partial [Cytophagales bacterium]|nr:cell surface protein SprA [Cytophaga sp.]